MKNLICLNDVKPTGKEFNGNFDTWIKRRNVGAFNYWKEFQVLHLTSNKPDLRSFYLNNSCNGFINLYNLFKNEINFVKENSKWIHVN